MNKSVVNLYYSIVDPYPAYRVDLSELFAKSLSDKGLKTFWFMANNTSSLSLKKFIYFDQPCLVPPRFSADSRVSRLVNKVFYWITDTLLMLCSAFRKFDILQTRDKYFVSIIGLIAARLSGKRFVYWCSYPFPEQELELANERQGLSKYLLLIKGKLAFFFLYQIIMRFSDHSFVQSKQMLNDLEGYGLKAERMTPVPMGVPQRLLEWAKSHPTSIVSGRVVYLGTMASVRQLHVLIDAFAVVRARCPQATLLMVGDGDHPHERLALEQQVVELGLCEAVQFTGFVPLEDAWSYSTSAQVCVSPFFPNKVLASTSPTKLVEYMAMSRPVVCNDHPEQSEIIRESGAGICVAWGVNEFAEAIIWMLEHPQEAEAMGLKGPAWVAENRTYPIIAKAVWSRYQAILGLPA